jgi:4-amino-4-deoxy-L-arabinose transferase-like glycosyltransferase
MTPSTSRLQPGLILLVCALSALWIWSSWVGYLHSDDTYYAAAARGWISEFPYVGTTHWGLRHTIVLPMAAGFAVFGVNEFTLILPFTIYAALLLTGIWFFLRSRTGDLSAALAVLIAASTPILAEGASLGATDLVEAFYVLLSFWLFHMAAEERRNRALLIGSGIAAGFAWLTRETSVSLLAFYGVMFLFSRRLPRTDYFWMAGGFIAVWLADTIYLGINTGDLLHRLNTSLRGVSRDNPALGEQVAQGFDQHGNIATPEFVRPLTMLLTNRSFALLFWVGIPAALHLCFWAAIPTKVKDLVRLSCGLALTWFLVLAYGMYWLWDIPRYQTVTAVVACIVVAVWVRFVLLPRSIPAAAALLVGVLAVSTLAGLVANPPSLFGERVLAAWARSYAEPIYTDSGTLQGAGFLLETGGTSDRVVAGAPPQGALFAYNPAPRRQPENGPLKPDSGWTVVERRIQEEKLVSRALRSLGVLRLVPASLASKLAPPPGTITLYRVG